MAQKLDYNQPFNDLRKYVPQNLRNQVSDGLLDNLFNRFLTHDEGVPLYGFIGSAVSGSTAPRIPQSSVERDLNTIVPVLSFDVGTEKYAFTVEDLLKKADLLGISPGNRSWLYSQGNNFLPPIDPDRFTNFFNYYWTGKVVNSPPATPWNTELLPEYYVIQRPQPADPVKLNARVSSSPGQIYQLTGTGFLDQKFKLTFSDPHTFTISLSAALLGPLGLYTPVTSTFSLPVLSVGLTNPADDVRTFTYSVVGAAGTFNLLTFKITRAPRFNSSSVHIGYYEFAAGDTITLDTKYISSTYSIAFTGSSGIKPKVSSVKVLSDYQTIDGIQLKKGDRVLIQGTVTDSGIWVVGPQGWSRAADFTTGTWAAGAEVYVTSGTVNGGKLWQSFGSVGAWGWAVVGTQSNTVDWQEANFWVKGDELEALGFSRSTAVQATRPIIEYSSTLQLNAYSSGGVPGDYTVHGRSYRQTKTDFNQVPLFDLFRYDGTHAGLVSSIFYYVEDLTANIDLVLQRRVKVTSDSSADFIFNHGCVDANGELLFFRQGGDIKTVWHAGYLSSQLVDTVYTGTGNGTLSGVTVSSAAYQQIWTLTATSATTFSIVGSKHSSPQSPFDVVTVGVPYTNPELRLTINAGVTAFVPGDTFILRVAGLEQPRYAYRDTSGSLVDLLGGITADTAAKGDYLIPRTFTNNPFNESRGALREGVAYAHFRGMMNNQPTGAATNYAFGGSIKLWSEQHTLLASLLMQKDLTPISMIDLSMRQYDAALNAIRDLCVSHVVDYFGQHGITNTTADVTVLLDYLLTQRALDDDVRTVLFDTTAGVVGFPATLPQLGISALVQPSYAYDPVLKRSILVHHDGHETYLEEDTDTLRQEILNSYITKQVLRSDGTTTPAIGSFTATPPALPYRGQLWLKPTGELLGFDVVSDGNVAPTPVPAAGEYWYNRTTNKLWLSTGTNWVVQSSTLGAWKQVDFAAILNSLMLQVETRLYNATNPNQRKYDFAPLTTNAFYLDQLKCQLFYFAAANNFDPLGSDYSATDPFTWNYSQAAVSSFAPLSTAAVPARWYNTLVAHQQTVAGVLPTQQPSMEPWRLFGFATRSAWWATLTAAQQAAYTPFATTLDYTFTDGGYVRVVQTTPGATPLAGLPTIDGVALAANDLVLLTSEAAPANNGIWKVSSGVWTRAANPLVPKLFVTVSSGATRAGTTWALTAAVPTINVDPVSFKQVRIWSDALWADVAAARPTLRTSVNPYTDTLLPPYVSLTSSVAGYALTNTFPPGVANGYLFGEGSPVEEVWRRSIEFGYAQAKALFRFDPMAFLGFCWGFNWVSVDGILYDGYDLNVPGHSRFKLHGEAVRSVPRTVATALTYTSVSGPTAGTLSIRYDAYDASRRQNFSVRLPDGSVIGYLQEGVTSSISGSGYTLTNARIDDLGQPFRVGDAFTVPVSGAATFTAATYHQILGFGQTFTNALRAVSIDTASSYSVQAFRGWDVNMGYRAGGLVATDDLHVYTDSDTLNSSSYNLIVKRNDGAKSLWLHALRVTVTQYGTLGIVNGIPQAYPGNNASDWTFRIEGYNPRYLELTRYIFSPTSDRVTFNALSKAHTALQWTQPTDTTGTVTVQLPVTITGLQNVIDFLFGYIDYITDAGWSLSPDSDIDYETGRGRTWQLEVEKLIDRVYAGIQPGQGHVFNPFLQQVVVKQPTGLLAPFKDQPLFDVLSHAAVYDALGVKMPAHDIRINRGNLSSSFGAAAPMFSIHALVDEYEHLFIFNDYINTSDSTGLLYDPFSGSKTITYRFNGRQQATGTMRPEFGGHYLVGNEVKLNLQASTDNLATVYDPDRAFENELTSKHALALLGFSKKDYFSNLDITDKSQFNFWRGLIQSKGTNLSIDAYLNSDRLQDAKIYEYWAYKVAEYGDARQKTYPELKLQVADTIQQFTLLQFDAVTPLANFTQITKLDETRWFTIDDLNQDAYFKAEEIGIYARTFTASETYPQQVKLDFIADHLTTLTGPCSQLNATTLQITGPGAVLAVGYGPATPRYNPIKLFNYEAEELIAEIPHWHPAGGLLAVGALQDLNIISDLDPARYTFSTLVTNNAAYDPLHAWGDREIGRIWLDTRNLKFVPYFDPYIFPNRAERLSRWGALADYGSVDVYEWVRSTVPPSEYDALAKVDAGNADLDTATKASGVAGLQETYARDRVWSIHPVAWSYSPVPLNIDWGDRPPMKYSGDISEGQLSISGQKIWLVSGSFSVLGIVAGDSIGTWQHGVDPMPLTEGTINDTFSQLYLSTSTAQPVTTQAVTVGSFSGTVALSNSGFTTNRYLGQLLVTAETDGGIQLTGADGNLAARWDYSYYLRVTEVGSGDTYRFLAYTIEIAGTGDGSLANPFVQAPLVTTTGSGVTYGYDITELGIKFTLTSTTTGTVDASFGVDAIVAAFGSGSFSAHDATTVDWLISPPNKTYTNDPDDPLFATNNQVGWRAWAIPTQSQLDGDGRYPVSSWKPYVGDAQTFNPNYDQLTTAIAYAAAPLTLNDDTTVTRYTTTWTDWALLHNFTKSVTATVAGPISFSATDFGVTRFDTTQTSVYLNGIAQLKAAYTIVGPTLTILSVKQGHEATVIVRKYEPSTTELAFNPDVAEDLSFQRQYKKDYQYATTSVRGSEGTTTTTYYYFWVKNKTTVATKKTLSVQSLTQVLLDGPSSYLTFQAADGGLLGSGTASDPYRYDAISISGLSYQVTKDDTYKLRFTRNFTLRDDPQELDLKDTHTEWGLMHPGQVTKVPEALWLKLVDSTAGQDAAGNAIPSLRRVLYDERNGTSTSYGFGSEQTLAPSDLLRSTLAFTVVNTTLTVTTTGTHPNYISFIDAVVDLQELNSYTDPQALAAAKQQKINAVMTNFFSSPAQARSTLTQVWTSAEVGQVNELFFAALEDILASSFELTDIFKTSRLSVSSTQTETPTTAVSIYE